jgi:parallel beta-helix repeat protein
MTAPFKTMKKAASAAKGGDIVYLRDGVYNQAENFGATGAAGNPVVFMAQPGEHPILDGTGLSLGKSDSVLQLNNVKHVVVAGLEIRNSSGRGVQLLDSDDVVIRDCTIHDVGYKALGLNGSNLVAQGNTVYNSVLSNKNSGSSGGWPPSITTQMLSDGSPSSNVIVRNNIVHDSWGECIDALFVTNMTITGNQVSDCWSVGIYIDTARTVRVEGNIVHASNQAFVRNGHLMDGILMTAEAYDSSPDYGAENVVVANNIVAGVHNGIGWWNDSGNSRASNSYLNVQVVSNTVWGSSQNAIMFAKVPSGRNTPSGTLVDNILYGSSSSSLSIGDTGGWTLTSNDFPNGKPSGAGDASNIAVDPQLTGTPSATAAPTAFRPGASAAVRHAGRPVAGVPLDFACATRGTTDTTIGAFE